ncbi:MAG: M23 family metallopeptidase [Bacteroidales bacterium]|nr:M23 family metallopeptidase [Bacteroidales bacterium]
MNLKFINIISVLFFTNIAVLATDITDNIPQTVVEDSSRVVEEQEDEFQNFLDTVFMGVDTLYWNCKMINSGRFDSKAMTDTIRIPLNDSSLNGLRYCHPFKNYISSNFGPRRFIFHYGVDIKLYKGDPVCAAFDGIVRLTKYDRRGFGNVVVIRHPFGLETIYGHLSKTLVTPMQKVKAGDIIGLGGNSGRSTGSHLHFEIRYRGEPFDPNYFIDFNEYKLKTDTLVLTRSNFEYLIELRKAKYCTIRKGDTLSKIARRYNTTVSQLCKLNHISRKTILRPGRKLRYQ